MFNLIKANIYRITKRRDFKIILLFILVNSVFFTFMAYKHKENLEIITYPLMSKTEYKTVNKYDNYTQYKKRYKIYLNNMEVINKKELVDTKSDLKTILLNSTNGLYIIGFIIIFLSFQLLGYDLTRNTIRYIYISNHKRSEILFSYIFSLIIITFLLLIISMFFNLVIATILTNKSVFLLNGVISISNKLIKGPFIIIYILNGIKFIIPFVFLIVFSLFLCLMFKGNSVSIIISIILYLSSSSIFNFCLSNGFKIIELVFISHLDVTYLYNKSDVLFTNLIYNTHLSYLFSYIILIIYTLIFLSISLKLVKRDT